MGTLLKGLHEFEGAYVGSSEVQKIYKGDTLVFDGNPYHKVEYLQATGTQWINSGIKAVNKMTIEVEYSYSDTSQYGCVFDAQTGNFTFIRRNNTSNTYSIGLPYQKVITNVGSIVLNTKYKAIAHYERGNSYVKVDGTTLATSTDSFSNDNYNIYLFACNQGNSALFLLKGKIYSFKVTVDNVVTFDGVPVRSGQTGYLYDKVSKTLLSNSGSGSFTLGPDI